MSRSATRLLAVAVAAIAVSGCYRLRGADSDETRFHQLPPHPGEAVRGAPRYSAVFEGAFKSWDGSEVVVDDNTSFYYSRLLRKSMVFEDFFGPDTKREMPGGLARVRIEMRYATDPETNKNFAKALVPGLLSYRFDLMGTATFYLLLPGEADPLVYQATTAATRLYYSAGRTDAAKQILYQQVDDRNFLNIVRQMNADERLYRPER